MSESPRHPILAYLRQVLGAPAGGGVADAELLQRFVKERDQAAFELLMWRHAAMVLHVCRQVLGDPTAAEDAFQATFLVLVRKGGSISRREALGSWLYRVAYRTALKARMRGDRLSAAGAELDGLAAPIETDDAGQRELRRMIGEEVNRLPAKYRAVIVACFFEGKSHEEAASQLGWPRGTVAGRLSRARDLLRRRLTRRGVTLGAAALTAALSAPPARAMLARLIESTLPLIKQFAAGQSASALASPRVAALTEGVLQTMNGTRLKIAMALALLLGISGAGATLWATQRRQGEAPAAPQPPAAGVARAEEDRREAGAGEARPPEDTAQLARDMARSRLNLKQLALAMHNYGDIYAMLPPAALTDKKGKALLSWRVALLPFIEQQELYRQFKLDEPWDSPHNKKLLSKMPTIYAPPGIKTRQPYTTFYQVFVSAALPGAGIGGGMAGMPGGMPPGGGMMMGPGMMPGGGPSGMRGGSAPRGGSPGTPGAGPAPRGGASGSGRAAPGMPAGAPAAGGSVPGNPAGTPAAGGAAPGSPGGPPAMNPPSGGGAGMGPAGGAGMGAMSLMSLTPFVKGGRGVRWPASITDGTSNTILIIEAGNPVPWTKPEDLHYAEDEPLPELGGLFSDVIHAAFADGSVHTLKRGYDEKQMRYAIMSSDGNVFDRALIEGRSRRAGRAPGRGGVGIEGWQQKNVELRREVERARERIRLLKEQREVERELAGEDPRINQLKEENARLQAELKKLHAEMEALDAEIRRMQRAQPGKEP